MEVAIRQQISDAKKKEQQLYQKEDELRKLRLEQLTEFEEQKKTIVEERKWLESLRKEIDSRMATGPQNQTSSIAPPTRPKSKSNRSSTKAHNSNNNSSQ